MDLLTQIVVRNDVSCSWAYYWISWLSVLQFVFPPHVQLKLPTQHVLVEMFVVEASKSTLVANLE